MLSQRGLAWQVVLFFACVLCLCVRCAGCGVGQPQWRGYFEPGNCVHGHVFFDLFSWPHSLSSLSYVMVDMVPLYFHSIFWPTLSPVTAIFMVDMVSCASLSPFLAPKLFFLVTAFSWWTWSLCYFSDFSVRFLDHSLSSYSHFHGGHGLLRLFILIFWHPNFFF